MNNFILNNNFLLKTAAIYTPIYVSNAVNTQMLYAGMLVLLVLAFIIFIDLFFIPTAILSTFGTLIFFGYLVYVGVMQKEVETALILLSAFIVLGIVVGLAIKKYKLLNIIALKDTVPRGAASGQLKQNGLVGEMGRALTSLRPSGKVKVKNKTYDAISAARFINKGKEVRVIKISGVQLVVAEKK